MIIVFGEYFIYLQVLFVLLYILVKKNLFLLITAALSGSLAVAIGWLIKSIFYLPRPFILTGISPQVPFHLDGSFPSNHAALAWSLAWIVYWSDAKAGLICMVMAVLVSLGRILGGVHTSVDVAVGFLIGLFLSLVIRRLTPITPNARLLKWPFH